MKMVKFNYGGLKMCDEIMICYGDIEQLDGLQDYSPDQRDSDELVPTRSDTST